MSNSERGNEVEAFIHLFQPSKYQTGSLPPSLSLSVYNVHLYSAYIYCTSHSSHSDCHNLFNF